MDTEGMDPVASLIRHTEGRKRTTSWICVSKVGGDPLYTGLDCVLSRWQSAMSVGNIGCVTRTALAPSPSPPLRNDISESLNL